MSGLLFLYGVLLGDVAAGPARALLHGLGAGKPARTRGLLHAVPDDRGAYPALVQGDGWVHGTAHETGTVDLVALDRFEGVRADGTGEYRRAVVPVTFADGIEAGADAYLYNRPLQADWPAIPHGDFRRWLADTGASAFSGA